MGDPVLLTAPVSVAQIRALLRNTEVSPLLPQLGDHTPLTEAGVDSVDVMEIVEELQRASGLEIPDDDLERMSSIADIAGYLTERMQ